MNLYISKGNSASEKNIVLDDMILTVDMPTTAGSKMLEGYKSLFEAEILKKLRENGYNICGKANTGEMAIDLMGETSYFGACTDENGILKNACAEIVKNGEAVAAVTLDVNGTPERAASQSMLTYIKPTYGTVSRFGTIPAACSGETVGVTAKSAKVCREVLSVIEGHDDKDGTSLPEEKCRCAAEGGKIKKIAVAKSLLADADGETKALIEGFKAKSGAEFAEIDADELLLAKTAWNILMSAEVCNNVSRYDGVKYGYRSANYKNIDELYTNSRTESFGYLLKSTVLFGSDALSEDNYMKVYDKALRIRRVISEYMDKILGEYDAVLMPACSKRSYSASEINKYTAYDESLYTAPALITGLPAVVTCGVQLVGKAFSDGSLLELAAEAEKEGK